MSTSTMSAHAIPSHEQSELDEILRELLGDTHTTTTRSPSHRVQPSAHPPVNYGRGHSVESPDGNGWLEQQQRKLSQRQLSREQEDVTQRHRQQKQLLSELRHVQTKRQDSLADDFNANNMYRTERDVMVTTQEPAAYTVYIKPEEQPQEIVQEETKTSISKSSVTNVSHTHHNHYNFHDNSDEEQKRRIKELEDELRKVKTGLHQQSPPPVRPQKLNFDDEDEEEYSFKPVGIASLESGTDGTSRSRLAHFSSTSSAASTPVGTSKQVVSTPTTPVSPVVTTNGQPITQTNTTQSRSMYSSNISSPQLGAVMSPSHNVVTSSHNLVTSSPLSPPTPYQLMSPLTSPFSDTVQPGTGSRQQRTVMEEKRVQQHIYHHPVYPAGGSQVGTLPSQHSMTQVNRQQHEPVTAAVSYGLASIGSPGNLTGTENLPFNQALQAGASNVHTDQPGVIYTSIAGSTSPPGRSQHTNDSVSNQTADYGQPLSAKFVKDTSKYWYKPHIGRDEVIFLLKNEAPGSFIVRDSNSFPGAFGLAVKVAQLPANIQVKAASADPAADYVRFYLIEPTNKGVRLKGCSNEPVFASLASLIYQHTITELALPCKLLLPDRDQYQFKYGHTLRSQSSVSGADELDGPPLDSPGLSNGSETRATASSLLDRGAACNVVYMNNVDTESLTGPAALSRAIHHTFGKDVLETTNATFKVSADGITITDNNRRIFFRQHFPKDSISYCGIDPADRRFTQSLDNVDIKEAKIFGFVAKRKGGNQCLLFAEMDPEQPASAVVNFVCKVLLGQK